MSVPGKQFTWGPANVDALLSSTLASYRKKYADNVFTRIPLFMWFKKKARIAENGGANLVVPLMYGKNSTAGSYSGYGIIDTTPQEGLTASNALWCQEAASISISGLEERVQNVGDKAIIKLLETKIKQAEMSMSDQMDIQLWASAKVKATDLQPLPTIVDTTSTIQDVSRSSNSWWQAQVVASGSFAARGLADMRNLYNTIMNQSLDNSAVDFTISAQSPYEFYEATLQPQQRFSDPDMANAGFENLRYKASAFTFSTNCPSGNLFMLRSENLKLAYSKGTNFITTPFIKPENQDAKVAQILWAGQLVTDNSRKLGKLTGITA